ncbi:MAG: hypothetical protein K2N05_03070 [Muribaculaceae bacterium]|nr:hypothetical protein [Muribaculaceae bacterium]
MDSIWLYELSTLPGGDEHHHVGKTAKSQEFMLEKRQNLRISCWKNGKNQRFYVGKTAKEYLTI